MKQKTVPPNKKKITAKVSLRKKVSRENIPPVGSNPSRAKAKISMLSVIAIIVLPIGGFLAGSRLAGATSFIRMDQPTALRNLPIAAIPTTNTDNSAGPAKADDALLASITEKVLPGSGFPSKIRLGDTAVMLAEKGVIDPEKFTTLYASRGGLPDELKDVLTKPSPQPILLTKKNASIYLNLLWPIGLANQNNANQTSPIKDNLDGYASTGGWTLGKESGGAYFNTLPLVPLTAEQEAIALRVAQSTYRPCCGNSAFFQDCNHGSAMYGLLQLGAAQGLSEEDLYKEALAFNSFWFASQYVQTAVLFQTQKNTSWESVDPKEVLGKDYSTIQGWSQNVLSKTQPVTVLGTGGGCAA
jgi:hypothetical protein